MRKQEMAEEQEAGSTTAELGEASPPVVKVFSSSEEPQDVVDKKMAEEQEAGSTTVDMAAELGEASPPVVEVLSDLSQDVVDNSVYCHMGRAATIGRHDYLTLRPGEELNDDVINGMLYYLSRDIDWCHCFTTNLVRRYLNPVGENQQDSSMSLGERRYAGVSRWTRMYGINLETKAVVLFPVNWENHWYLIVATDLSGYETSITVLNSVQGVGNVPEAVAAVKEYLYYECNLDRFKIHVPQVPRQSTRNDCGIFTILYGQFLLKDLHNFQVHGPYSPPPTCFDSF